MIVDLPDTTTEEISKKIVSLRRTGGAVTLGRVLSLVIDLDDGDHVEDAVAASNKASREHPCRVIMVVRHDRSEHSRLDAELRVGGDAGASEVVVLHLTGRLADHPHAVVTPFLLPDTPVVTWWPGRAPARPSDAPLGRLASRRITDSRRSGDPGALLSARRVGYAPGDTDLAWAAITQWRAMLVSALDRPPHTDIVSASVTGPHDLAGLDLFAGWLASALDVPVTRVDGDMSVTLVRSDGELSMSVGPEGGVLRSTGHPDGRSHWARRTTAECLAEELRSLDADEVYESALHGLSGVTHQERH
ncbi:glucose-6-phosphate dehydrogenase assembly protein OpcA [Gordonia hydrophobica]|uniref:Glucose-6-phosphate dehydrogenase assembly protein OpcA n=1 Tax=Gordonia hydrophobica TaxID=40516 RepID=A0ABZ2U0A4_9ACTN|nr:glucose-6-phosphate dehydrogenase assembly protein OpcA [Gordonia hydrophobica]MBM7369127.1 glucose-6-phosphate dehydrogenase assembly protein OpcA [Gordonia hydrophobica]